MGEFLAAGMHWKLLNFGLFVGVLFFLLRKPVSEFWASRSHQIRFDLEESERMKRESIGRHGDLEKRVSRIEGEVKDLVRSLKGEGELEKERLIQEAERLSRRMREDGERIAAQEVRKAKEALKIQTVQLSMELAERLVRENVRETDQKRITERYLADLEGGAA